MKALVIYYSLDGNTRFIAEKVAGAVGAEIMELKPRNDIKSKGFSKYFWGGRQVIMKIAPELLPLDKNPNDYDLIFLGTPVWASTFTPAWRTFFTQIKLSDKKLALFCCYGGNKGKTFDNLKKELVGNEIIGEIEFREPLKNDPEGEGKKVTDWVKKIVAN